MNTTSASSKNASSLWRSLLAVLTGLVFIVVTSIATDLLLHATGIFPPLGKPMSDRLFAIATIYRSVYAVIGCYITARMAPTRSMFHALILGAIGVVLSLVGLLATWNQGPEFGPKWYAITLVVTALPLAWVGGKLRK